MEVVVKTRTKPEVTSIYSSLSKFHNVTCSPVVGISPHSSDNWQSIWFLQWFQLIVSGCRRLRNRTWWGTQSEKYYFWGYISDNVLYLLSATQIRTHFHSSSLTARKDVSRLQNTPNSSLESPFSPQQDWLWRITLTLYSESMLALPSHHPFCLTFFYSKPHLSITFSHTV